MTLDQMLIRASECARAIVEMDGREPLPAFVCQNAQGQVLPILAGAAPTSAESFGALLEIVRDAMAAFGAVRYVSALHGYALEGRAAREYRGGPVADNPDRREVIAFCAVEIDGTARAGHCYVLRPEHGAPKLSPLHDLPADNLAALGAVASLLKPSQESATRH